MKQSSKLTILIMSSMLILINIAAGVIFLETANASNIPEDIKTEDGSSYKSIIPMASYGTITLSGKQVIDEDGICSYNEYHVKGEVTGENDDGDGFDQISCNLWDDGELKDQNTIYVEVGVSMDIDIVLAFGGLYGHDAPGVGIECSEIGVNNDPFYPVDTIGDFPDHYCSQQRPDITIDDLIDGTGRKAVVLTHGYMSNVEAWAISDTDENGIADKICKDIDPNATLIKSGWYANILWLRCHTSEWDVYVYDWRAKAKKLTPISAYGEAFDQGINLAEKLADKNYAHVHMLAHSAGSNLIDMASEHLKTLAPDTEIHLTFFDAYDPMAQLKCGEQLSAYGKSADFVDNYVDIRTLDTLFIGDLDGTKLFLPNAFNVDVTKWDKREEPLPPAAALFRHEWPYVFYNEWTFMPMTYDMGYQITLEDGHYKPANRKTGKACILSSEGINGQPVCESIRTVCDLAKPDEDVRTIGDPVVVIGQITKSVTGAVSIINDLSGLLVYWFLETGSPVWSNMSLTLMKPVNSLEFDYEFLSSAGAEGYLTVYFDGEVVGHIDERYIDTGKQASPRFALGRIEPGIHSLAFRVDPFTTVKSSVKLSNVKLINVNTAPVFPWPMFLPAINGGNYHARF